MLNVRLGRVVDCAAKNESMMEAAVQEFFDGTGIDLPVEYQDQISQLFNEWLVFDFKPASGPAIISQYYFRNPDNLPKELLEELKQIIETQTYDFFEVIKTNPGQWMDVWGLFTGKKYRVSEISLSAEMANLPGSFCNRVAQISNSYFFVGGNPLVFPITYTDRAKKLFGTAKGNIPLTPKYLLKYLIEKSQTTDTRLSITKHDIKVKRKRLKAKFDKLVVRYGLQIDFDRLVDFVYLESYRSHYADFYKDIAKIGVSEDMILENIKFFQDLWNYFPHKKLNGKCPAEKFKQAYG